MIKDSQAKYESQSNDKTGVGGHLKSMNFMRYKAAIKYKKTKQQ